jgi:hypothetical protein
VIVPASETVTYKDMVLDHLAEIKIKVIVPVSAFSNFFLAFSKIDIRHTQYTIRSNLLTWHVAKLANAMSNFAVILLLNQREVYRMGA